MMKQMIRKIKDKDILAIAVCVITILIIIILTKFFLTSWTNEIFQIQKKIDNEEKIKMQQLSKLTHLKSVDDESVKKYFNDFEYILPRQKNISLLLSTIGGLGTASGLSIGSIKLSPGVVYPNDDDSKKNSEVIETINFNLALDGDQEQIMNFFNLVNNSKQLLNLININLGVDKENIWHLKVEAESYFAPLPKPNINQMTELSVVSKNQQKALKQIGNLRQLFNVSLLISGSSAAVLNQEPRNPFLTY